MKKTNRKGRKLLLRRDSVAHLTPVQLERAAGGVNDTAPGSQLYPVSCHVSDVVGPVKKS